MIPDGIVTTGYGPVQKKCRELGIEHAGWQQGVGQLMLGKRETGKYAATVGGVVLSIARQVGKTFLVGSIIFALCLLFPGLTVLWTAHHTRTSDETFEAMQALAERPRIKPFIQAVRTANGQQAVIFRNGSRTLFGARSQGFGRGFSNVDIEVFDEAQILTPKALDDMVAATNQARHMHGALLFFMGTPPAPTDPGEAFASRRGRAISGRTTDMVFVEISADQDADPDDQEQWLVANPSVPDWTPIESMHRLRENLGSDESFMREGLGIWSPNSLKQVIDPSTWVDAGDINSIAVDRFALGVDVNPDRTIASVSLAGQRVDGDWHVELDETREGIGWVVPYVARLITANPQIRAVVIDSASQAATLLDAFKAHSIRVTQTDMKQMAGACGGFYTGIVEGWLHHIGQVQLAVALSVARKRPLLAGSAWGWNRKNAASDITPLVSSTLALWGAMNSTVKRPGRRPGGGGRKVVVL